MKLKSNGLFCISASLAVISGSLILAACLFSLIPLAADGCPRMECAPIVSKCQIVDACRCEAQLNYTCFLACSRCLGPLYADCCSCVDICPKDNTSTHESHVKLFSSPNDDLFELFAQEQDSLDRWHVTTLPVTTANSSSSPVTSNCSMIYLANCLSMDKCESSCVSMGASGFRWFHVGCCECIGKYCLNFGFNDVRCRRCPTENDQVIDSVDDSHFAL